MPTIAILGAGPGMGMSIARVFGRQGFGVALIARNEQKLNDLVAELGTEGISAAAFTADVMQPETLTSALEAVKNHFGRLDVVEYSPAPKASGGGLAPVNVVDVTIESLQPQIEYYLYGAVTAARAVLPAMLEAGAGTLLFSSGGGSVSPIPVLGNVNAAAAALRNWAINLHNAVADTGVHVAHIALNLMIDSSTPESTPSTIAGIYWEAYTSRSQAEHVYPAL